MMKTKSRTKKMSRKSKPASVAVNEGMFFPSDFAKLPKRTVIFIKRGRIIFLDRLKAK